MLLSIRMMLTDLEVEERDIRDITFNLYRAYARRLRDEILRFVETTADTYIDFGYTSVVLRRAEETIGDVNAQEVRLRDIIQEMNREYSRLRQSKELLECEGRNNFFKKIIGIIGSELVFLTSITYFKLMSVSIAIQYLIATVIVTYFVFREFYKRYLMVGPSAIFSERAYYER